MKATIVLSALLLLFHSCYTYKALESKTKDFVVGEKYEIRLGNRNMIKVIVSHVTDSTIVVEQNKSEITINKSIITESKQREFSLGRTIAASIIGALVTISAIGIFTAPSGNDTFLTCC